MGEPLYLQDPERPDERERIVRGIEKTIAAPPPATRYHLLPVADWVYDPAGQFWLPKEQAAGVVIALLNQIASYTEDSAESSAQIRQEVYNTRLRIVEMLAQMPDYRGLLHEVINALGDQTDAVELGLGALVSGLLRGGTPERLAGSMAPPITALAEQDVMRAWGTRQGTKYLHDLGWLEGGVARKWVGTDPGAYVSPVAADGTTISFTGVNLSGRVSYIFNVTDRTVHLVTAVQDPVPPAAGTLTVSPPLRSANAVLRIPYRDVPHAYNTAVDALQVMPVTAEIVRANGPAVLVNLSQAGPEVAVTYNSDAFTVNYGRFGLEISWSNVNAANTYALNLYGRLNDDAAWPATVPGNAFDIATWLQATGGSSAWNTALQTGTIVCRFNDQHPFREIRVARTAAGVHASAVQIRVIAFLYGGNR